MGACSLLSLPNVQDMSLMTSCMSCFSSDAGSAADGVNEDELKARILQTALMYVPVHGWSAKSLQLAVEKEGYPGVGHGMFPRYSHLLVRFQCMVTSPEMYPIDIITLTNITFSLLFSNINHC